MKVSITVPTYNQGPYIAECLESIRVQTHRDLEVIIQDSVSQDETQKICEDYAKKDGRFKYYREKDSGQSDAINRGLNRSTGDLWTWICSDDYYANPNAIESLTQAIETAPNSNFMGAFGKAEVVSEKGIIVNEYHQLSRDLDRSDFKLNWPLSQPSSVLKLSEVKRAGGVKQDLHLGMDLDLFIRLLEKNGQLRYVPSLIASIRLQPESKSVKFRKKTAENALAIIKQHFGDTGNASNSAYAQELIRINDEDWAVGVAERFTRIPAVKGIQTKLFQIMRPGSDLKGFQYTVFRAVWSLYRLIKSEIRRCIRRIWAIYIKIKLSFQ